MKNVDDVRSAREDLDTEVAGFLRGKGWKHTSSTPGCYWMWEKEVDGRLLLVEESMALNIQSHLEQQEEVKSAPAGTRWCTQDNPCFLDCCESCNKTPPS